MNKQQALDKYRGKNKLISSYRDYDQFVVINDDPDLEPIKIPQPEPPDWDTIDGFGLEPDNQFWKPPKIPHGLIKPQSECETVEQMWDTLEKNQDNYREEILFIKKQWYYRINGCWFFNKGKPTYITKDHFMFCAYWTMDVGLPKYKNIDRKLYCADHYLEELTTSFKDKDKDGYAVKNENDEFELVDMMKRVFAGLIFVTNRRNGKSYKAGCKGYNKATLNTQANFGIQARDDNDAYKSYYNKVVLPWRTLPFFFKPKSSSTSDPQTRIVFDDPVRKSGVGTIISKNTGLLSVIDYRESGEKKYDGDKLIFFYRDEPGKQEKKTGIDISLQWETVYSCLLDVTEDKLTGWAWWVTTAGEMSKGGGTQFKDLCDKSDFYKRDDNGQTVSGLCLLFIPADEDGNIDKYGFNDREKRREFIMNKRQAKLDAGDIIGWAQYVRDHPLRYSDCWIGDNSENHINIYVTSNRLKELRQMNPKPYQTGELIWKDDVFGGEVEWIETVGKTPKCYKSIIIEPDQTNRRQMKEDNHWWPVGNYTKFTAGADPYRFDKTTTSKMSYGAGSVYWIRDKSIDPDKKPRETWDSDRFVFDYLYRPATKEIYCEDMLKMCIYFGCMIYPEMNVDIIQEMFIKWGFGGYLKYDINTKGRKKQNCGYYSASDTDKQRTYDAVRNYIEKNGVRERHPRILEQAQEIAGIADLTNKDAFASAGACLRSIETKWTEIIEENEQETDVGDIMEQYKY